MRKHLILIIQGLFSITSFSNLFNQMTLLWALFETSLSVKIEWLKERQLVWVDAIFPTINIV